MLPALPAISAAAPNPSAARPRDHRPFAGPAAGLPLPCLIACDAADPDHGFAQVLREGSAPGESDGTGARAGAWNERPLAQCSPEYLRSRARALGIREVVMDLPRSDHAARSRLLALCTQAGLRLTVSDDSRCTAGRTRAASIGDLLARPSRDIDQARIAALVCARPILVTGAGGSIGSVLCEEIARFQPARLILLDQSEYALYRTDEMLARLFPHVQRVSLVADVRRPARIAQILDRHRPAVVFHAAAHKHVPLLEDHNAWEALRNNVAGTEVMARAAMQSGVERFVLVSTDKAVNPVSVMGASKRMAEMVCQALQQNCRQPRFEIVRFGNVVGSAGSVIPLFEDQIRRGERLTVTHPDMRRYFMSLPEAARLLLQAATMGQGGEVFVMDMGEPVRLLDVARDMLHLAGQVQPDDHIEIIGLRPGERLFEELLAPGETVRSGEHPGLHIARARATPAGWLEDIAKVLAPDEEPHGWRDRLRDWVPEYRPGN